MFSLTSKTLHTKKRNSGRIVREIDGFHYFYPINSDGFLTDWAMLEIGQKLQDLNRLQRENLK